MISNVKEKFIKWKQKNKLDYYWGKSGVFFRELLWPCWQEAWKKCQSQNNKQIKEMKEALEYYADKKTYTEDGFGCPIIREGYAGQKAREVLEKYYERTKV